MAMSKRILKYHKRSFREPCMDCARRAVEERQKLAVVELPLRQRSGPQSEIEKYDLGSEVVRMYHAGMTQAAIAQDLGLSSDQVRGFLDKYREMSFDEKSSIHKRSIFDLGERLQETFEMVYTELQEIKGDNRDLTNKNLKLLLQCIQTGGVFMEKLHAQQDDRRYKAAMLQVMEDMAPGTKAKVLRALSDMDLNASMVRRLT